MLLSLRRACVSTAILALAAPLGALELDGLDHHDIDRHAEHTITVNGSIRESEVKLSSEEDIIIKGDIDGGHVDLHSQGKVIIEGAIMHGAHVDIVAHGFVSTGTVRGRRDDDPTRLTVRECDVLKIKGNIEDHAHVQAHAWDKVVVEGDLVHEAHLTWWADSIQIDGHKGESSEVRQENWGDFHHR